VAATDDNGNVLWREMYTPFGSKMDNPAANRDNEGYTGHIDDSGSGLTYMQARFYDPAIGRFLSNDPVGFAQGGPAYFNRYAYTANDPMNYVDPDGMELVIVGSEEYANQVNEYLDTLRETEEGAEAITRLEESDNLHQIVQPGYVPELDEAFEQAGLEANTTLGLEGSIDGTGGGSLIYFDANLLDGGEDSDGSTRRHPAAGLAHEIGHAVNNDRGVSAPNSNARHECNSQNELFPIFLENLVRQLLGDKERVR